MTATLDRPQPRPRRRQRAADTPASLRTLLIALVLLSLAWGGLGGWVADEHSSAASAMVTVDEPLSLDAQQLYQDVADADVTATTMFLASAQPPLASTQRYLSDIAAPRPSCPPCGRPAARTGGRPPPSPRSPATCRSTPATWPRRAATTRSASR